MLLFLTDKLFPKCILSPCLSQGRERGRRRGAGDPFSHWEGNIHLWAACKDKVVHRSGRQGSPIPTGCAGRWRWCQKLHYLPNAASLSHMAKFPLGLYLIKTNQTNKQKSMNTTKQTQQATEEWAEGFISVCYLDAFKQAALAIIYRGTGQLSGSLKEHGVRAGTVSPPAAPAFSTGQDLSLQNPQICKLWGQQSSCARTWPSFLVVWESGRGLSILPVPSSPVQDWCPRYKRGLPCPHGRIPSPQRLQRVPGRTGVCLSALLCTNSCFCKYVSHEQLAPTVTRSHLCRVLRGSCSFAGTEDELKQPTVPSLPPSWGDHRSAKCPLSAPELGVSV